MADFKLTEARARVLREIVHGTSAHKEMYGKRSFGCDPKGRGATTDITRIIAPLYAENLIKLIPDRNGWRMGWAPTQDGIDALAQYDKEVAQ